MLRIIKVSGQSMSPTLSDGDYLWVLPRWRRRYRLGDIIVVAHPRLGTIVKRISALNADGQFELQGDNLKQSTSSAQLGAVSAEDIIGRVLTRVTNKPS